MPAKIPGSLSTGICSQYLDLLAVFAVGRRRAAKIDKIPGYFPGSREYAAAGCLYRPASG
jgi:hypothetical protein